MHSFLVLFWFEFSVKTSESFTILSCPCGHFLFSHELFFPWAIFYWRENFCFAVSFLLLLWPITFLLRVFFFCRDFCNELFSFAVTFSFLPWEFFFRHDYFTFAVNILLFVASIFLLPQAFFLCRELFYFVGSFTLFPWHLWTTIVSTTNS